MPREAQGSNPIEGLKEARKILDQDHKTPGNILLVLDDVKGVVVAQPPCYSCVLHFNNTTGQTVSS